MTDTDFKNGGSGLPPCTMTNADVGKTMVWKGMIGHVLGVNATGSTDIRCHDGIRCVPQTEVKVCAESLSSVMNEVQDLMNNLIAAGQDKPRVLSRQVAQLLHETKGRLTRSERLQAAAMLCVAAGLWGISDEDDEL